METTCEHIYGINPAFEVARAGRRKIHRAFFDKAGHGSGRFRALRSLLERVGAPIESVDKGVLFQLAGVREHQGVVLRTDPYPYILFDDLVGAAKLLLIDNVEDPQNLGAILRSAEAFGWSTVLLPCRGVPGVYPSVLKASAGAAEYLHIAHDRTANAYVKALLQQNCELVALDTAGQGMFENIKLCPGRKLLLTIGGEHLAVGRYILNQAHHVVAIPMQGRVGSLNASVAAGLAMFMLKDLAQV